ncbi:flagellar protein FlgN [Paenibacillus sp. HJL G12]|uniref:Flagellar protein FlgN n=1 Tax=Paenibacillus dendrobii TaxID=2691084 RepID=A0A7X3IPN3_9BACL|nr:flagellar protein FlgN [Paenibacillus dendrobii]MWV46605.1 flagellar protein FlgN [Paenibacillus dendrobii]
MPLQPLIESLVRLNDEHKSMLKLAQGKKDAVMNNDVDNLIQILNHESRLMKRIDQLENERQEHCYAYIREKGIKSLLNLNLTELSRLVFDPQEKQQLKDIQLELANTLHELKQLNDLNQQLISQALAFVDYSLDLLGASPGDEPTYAHPAGKTNSTNRAGLFDAKA